MELKAAHRAAAIANAQNAAQLPELAHLIGRATPEKSGASGISQGSILSVSTDATVLV